MSKKNQYWTAIFGICAVLIAVFAVATVAYPEQSQEQRSNNAAVGPPERFATIMERMKADKPAIMERQMDLLNARYDLSDRPTEGVTMSRGKPIQQGVRVKLPQGVTWNQLASMTPDEIKRRNVFPEGFMPLPHPNHPEGGMVFPKFMIDEIKKQEERNLTRFDLDFDIPDHFLPEFPPAIFLTTRSDLGDVSKGQLITIDNYYATFSSILNPKQLEAQM